MTPDNKEVMITTGGSSNLLAWDRNTGGTAADHGRLTPATATARCVTASGTGNPAGTCQTRQGMFTTQSIAMPGNTAVYVGAQQSLSTVARDPATGNLTPDAAGNCFGYPTSSFAGCTPMPGGSPFVWYPARALAATPDGTHLYFGTESTPPGIFGYNRSGNSISRNAAGSGCINVTATEGCTTFRQGNRIQQVATAPAAATCTRSATTGSSRS